MLPERFVYEKMSFIKKNFIHFIFKEKSGTGTKLELVQKKCNQTFKKHNQLCFGALVLALSRYCGDNAQNTDFYQNTSFKEINNMAVKKTMPE